jgi:hypothetical protein
MRSGYGARRSSNWDDFVDLAFSEIRLYGASNFEVTRRLYSIIEDLPNVLRSRGKPHCTRNFTY